ncbi:MULTISPECIES: hypothetical protein [Pseudoalteromonas]|uniref:hypothetical protein n=2 Tax=Pseudoalteromonas TaxID=53246 RepID=UPI000AC5AB62|nr:hypothetical protein [Pseudoalteromonas prydzensis]MBE0379744.1 hypothetical protein [Pseudoalteromonas prydzensis ACAM 620]
MSNTLTILPNPKTILVANTTPANTTALASTEAETWQISEKKGTISGVGVTVSGAGAWAKMSGSFDFSIVNLESSRTYQKMVSEYSISGGVSGFWGWLGFGANAETHKQEIKEAMQELSQQQKVNGSVDVDLMVTGLIPGFEVSATAYILVLQIQSSSGATYNIASSTSPSTDVGAQDQNQQNLPTSNNNSTISL